MDEANHWVQFALATYGIVLTAVLGVGAWFVRRVIEMPQTYATKEELKEVADDWKGEMRQMREERREDNQQMQQKLDRIETHVTGIHRRIDSIFEKR